MVEMLGVLAVVGVLSVGALAGYSAAMTNAKANKAAEEIRTAISGLRYLYSGRSNYEGLHYKQLCTSGVWKNCKTDDTPVNMFGIWLTSVAGTYGGQPVARIAYELSTSAEAASGERKAFRETICKKILLSGWGNELGQDLLRIHVANSAGNTILDFTWDGANKFPITVSDANAACVDLWKLTFYVK
jgi:type II secretory pathway pseudopilin PulG